MEQVDLRLYAIVDPEHTGGHDLVDLTRAVAAGGATLVQLRDKVSGTPAMIEEARSRRRWRRSACRSSSMTASTWRSRSAPTVCMSARTT
jgi:thiamine monophosphate synthase